MSIKRFVFAGALACGLAGCGGGDDGGPVVDARNVPASAMASPEALNDYIASLPLDDTQEPLGVTWAEPPLTDVAEPLPTS